MKIINFYALTMALLWAALPARADYTVTIIPAAQSQAWDGWGVSLCWWANAFGGRDDIADALFTTKTVALATSAGPCVVPGLGLSIVRYNIGGSGAGMAAPPRLSAVRRIASFWTNGRSSDPASDSFDWDADFAQRTMLWKAHRRGVTQMEAFSNSPPWWLCASRSSAGGLPKGAENLPPENEAKFAQYLATVVKHAHDQWGITFRSVDAFNEPSANWWNFGGGNQEGCTILPPAQARIDADLRRELDNRGRADVIISASDENSYGAALSTWKSFEDATRGRIGRVNVHGYGTQNAAKDANRTGLQAATAGKPLWMSEYGENDASGLQMADAIARDINFLRPTGWVYWQALDRAGWGLIPSNLTARTVGVPNAKYFVLAQFSRHLRPGMSVLASGDSHTVAAFDPDAHKIVLVTINSGPAQNITYDLSALARAVGSARRWVTQPGERDRYARYSNIRFTGKTFTAAFAAGSVQTFEVEIAP